MVILTVGAGEQYTTIAAAVAASQDGDTIEVQAGTYTDDFATVTKNVNLVGVGGMVHMVADQNIPNGKAILVTDANVTIDHFEFSGAQVADMNGAGIRYEAGNLTITNSFFHDNQEGILTAPVTNGNLSIDHSEFAYNGTGDGFTHDIYVGAIGTFSLTNSYIHDANVGHEVKSRAAVSIIAGNRIFSNASGDSYEIDLPNGGAASIHDNIIQKGASSQNPSMISYGEEGSVYASSSLSVSNNLLVNQLTAHTPTGVNNYTTHIAQISGNQFYGLTAAQVASGANTQSGDTFLTSLPAIDSATNPGVQSTPAPSPSPTVIESNGSTDLDLVGGNYFFYTHGTTTGPELQYSGTSVTLGDGAWAPIAVEATASGYEVALKNGRADQYDVWNTDNSGRYVSELGVVPGSNTSLQSLETGFGQDLNRDGVIGLATITPPSNGGATVGTAADAAGNTSDLSQGPVVGSAGHHAPTPPPLVADAVGSGAAIGVAGLDQATVQESGAVEAGTTFGHHAGATLLGSTHTAAHSHLNPTGSGQGSHFFFATATDAAGHTSDFSTTGDAVIGSARAGHHAASPPRKWKFRDLYFSEHAFFRHAAGRYDREPDSEHLRRGGPGVKGPHGFEYRGRSYPRGRSGHVHVRSEFRA